MIELSGAAIFMLVLTVVLGALAYFVRERLASFSESIRLLFQKHDEDSARLDAFQLEIARKHYVKEELDARFDRLEMAFTKGFDTMGGKFDKLSDLLMDHIQKEDARLDRIVEMRRGN